MTWQVDFDQLRRGHRGQQFMELASRVQSARFAVDNGNLLAKEEQENLVRALELTLELLELVYHAEMMAKLDRFTVKGDVEC